MTLIEMCIIKRVVMNTYQLLYILNNDILVLVMVEFIVHFFIERSQVIIRSTTI